MPAWCVIFQTLLSGFHILSERKNVNTGYCFPQIKGQVYTQSSRSLHESNTAYPEYLLWVWNNTRNTSAEENFPALKILPKQNIFLFFFFWDKLHVLALTWLLITIKTTKSKIINQQQNYVYNKGLNSMCCWVTHSTSGEKKKKRTNSRVLAGCSH